MPLITTSDLIADEWIARGNDKWPQQERTLRERCSDLGETLDSWRDATEQCQLVSGSWLGGKREKSFLRKQQLIIIFSHIVREMLQKRFRNQSRWVVMWNGFGVMKVTLQLFCSSQLFLFLQDFSHRMLSKTHEIEKQLDSLIRDTKATDSCLHSVFNDFLMLSNTQFIENVMYTIEIFYHTLLLLVIL